MEKILHDNWCAIWAHTVHDPHELVVPPFGGADYACLLVSGDRPYKRDERLRLARHLISTRCRYVVVAGADNDNWVDNLFEANYDDPNHDTPDEVLVMVNWHGADDAPAEIVYTLVGLADYDDVSLRRFLILFLQTSADQTSRILASVPAEVEDAKPVWALRAWATLHNGDKP